MNSRGQNIWSLVGGSIYKFCEKYRKKVYICPQKMKNIGKQCISYMIFAKKKK
jgi:hypothetical protein